MAIQQKDIDELYMRRCLQLARCGAGSTSPNPMVGAVIVCDGRIIGEGYHIRAGEPHAEVNAVRSVKNEDKSLLRRSTMYVSLEPCSHYGKTPPCADLIISCRIPRVVVATTDFCGLVNGGGISRMRDAGIEVVVGVLQDESVRLNGAFFTFHREKRPLVVLKWAETADGFIDRRRSDASSPALAISTPGSMLAVHKLRAECDAIMVGARTALLDDPSLGLRYWAGRPPLRVVVDSHGSLPAGLRLFDGSSPTLLFTAVERGDLNGKNIKQIVIDFSDAPLRAMLANLYEMKVGSLLVEGGSALLRNFIDEGIWDRIRVERNPRLVVGDGVPAPVLHNVPNGVRKVLFGNDIIEYVR